MTTTHRPKALLSWSSGKDCAWALHRLRQQNDVEVVGLLTTLNQAVNRVAMHAVREALVDLQAAAVGLPLVKVPLPSPCSNEAYEAAMGRAMGQAKREGISVMAFGDLFLEDVRRYREEKLAPTGIAPVFPLWGANTTELAQEMIRAGLGAILTCVDPNQLDRSFVGRTFDGTLLGDLPRGVDPCGERGEFHTFAFAGPIFERPMAICAGEIVEREGFVFADLLPG